jgi:hypothetical protein
MFEREVSVLMSIIFYVMNYSLSEELFLRKSIFNLDYILVKPKNI